MKIKRLFGIKTPPVNWEEWEEKYWTNQEFGRKLHKK